MNQKGSTLIGLIIGVVIVGSLVVAYMIGQRNPTLTSQTPISTPAPISSPAMRNYPKRLFDVSSKWIAGVKYPSEVTDVQEQNLIGLKCSAYYQSTDGVAYEALIDGDPQKLTDQTLIGLIKKTGSNIGKSVSAAFYCEPNEGAILYEYETQAGGGGTGNVAHINLVSADGSIEKVTEIPYDGAAYFACRKPLQLTSANIFYIECGGGDGGGGAASVYSIDLNDKKQSQVLYCSAHVDTDNLQADGTPGTKVECK